MFDYNVLNRSSRSIHPKGILVDAPTFPTRIPPELDSSRTYKPPHDYFLVSPSERLTIAEALSKFLSGVDGSPAKARLQQLNVRLAMQGSALIPMQVVMDFLKFIQSVESLVEPQEVAEQAPFGLVTLSEDGENYIWLPYWEYGPPESHTERTLSHPVELGVASFAQFVQEHLIQEYWVQTPETDPTMYMG